MNVDDDLPQVCRLALLDAAIYPRDEVAKIDKLKIHNKSMKFNCNMS